MPKILNLSKYSCPEVLLALCNEALDQIEARENFQIESANETARKVFARGQELYAAQDSELGFMARHFAGLGVVESRPDIKPLIKTDRNNLRTVVMSAYNNTENFYFTNIKLNDKLEIVLKISLRDLKAINFDDFEHLYGIGSADRVANALAAKYDLMQGASGATSTPTKSKIGPGMFAAFRPRPDMLNVSLARKFSSNNGSPTSPTTSDSTLSPTTSIGPRSTTPLSPLQLGSTPGPETSEERLQTKMGSFSKKLFGM